MVVWGPCHFEHELALLCSGGVRALLPNAVGCKEIDERREVGRDRPACKEVEDLFQIFRTGLNAFACFLGGFALFDAKRNCGLFRGSFADHSRERRLFSCFVANADEVEFGPTQNKIAVASQRLGSTTPKS